MFDVKSRPVELRTGWDKGLGSGFGRNCLVILRHLSQDSVKTQAVTGQTSREYVGV